MIDRDNNMDVTLAIPVDGSVSITSQSSRFLILCSLVGLHVPNCELFAGKSKYKQSGQNTR